MPCMPPGEDGIGSTSTRDSTWTEAIGDHGGNKPRKSSRVQMRRSWNVRSWYCFFR